jgi:hypothetical protein
LSHELSRIPEKGLIRYPTEKLMVSLRDGRKLIGVLRSWDQFGRNSCFATITHRSY